MKVQSEKYRSVISRTSLPPFKLFLRFFFLSVTVETSDATLHKQWPFV